MRTHLTSCWGLSRNTTQLDSTWLWPTQPNSTQIELNSGSISRPKMWYKIFYTTTFYTIPKIYSAMFMFWYPTPILSCFHETQLHTTQLDSTWLWPTQPNSTQIELNSGSISRPKMWYKIFYTTTFYTIPKIYSAMFMFWYPTPILSCFHANNIIILNHFLHLCFKKLSKTAKPDTNSICIMKRYIDGSNWSLVVEKC